MGSHVCDLSTDSVGTDVADGVDGLHLVHGAHLLLLLLLGVSCLLSFGALGDVRVLGRLNTDEKIARWPVYKFNILTIDLLEWPWNGETRHRRHRTPCKLPPPSTPPLQSHPPQLARQYQIFHIGLILNNNLGAGGEGGHQLALVVQDEGSGEGGVGGRVKHSKGARDLPSLVFHQGDAQALQGGGSKLPEKDRMAHTTQEEPVRLNGVCGDGDDGALLALE